MQKTHPVIQRLVPILLLFVAGVFALYSMFYRPLPEARFTGEALVGGPFTMVNHRGEAVTEKDFFGRYTLIFFGFTYCPDVCPTELQVMAAALDQMGPLADKITPIFVSVDPERDTPKILSEYVASFHPRLVGLTGTVQQVKQMAKTYRVYFAKVTDAKKPQDYQIDHTAIIYLMGPDGKFLKHFSYSTDTTALAKSLSALVKG